MEKQKAKIVVFDSDGFIFIKFPNYIIEKLKIKENDFLDVEITDDNKIVITPIKKMDLEIDIDEDILFKTMLEAHKRDMTLNQLVTEAITEVIKEEAEKNNND